MKTCAYLTLAAALCSFSKPLLAADSGNFLRASVNYVDPTESGVSSEAGFSIAGGRLFGPANQHELALEWGWVKFSAQAPGAAVDEHLMPYLVNYRFHFQPSGKVDFSIGPSIGLTNEIIKAAAVGLGSAESSAWLFSWAVGTGLTVKLSNRANLELAYRYLRVGNTTHTLFGMPFNRENTGANVLSAGLGFRF